MPGIFGGIGCAPEAYETLRREFAAAWPDARAVCPAGGLVGGHAFGGAWAVHEGEGGRWIAVDGEPSLYPLAAAHADPGPLYRVAGDSLETTAACAGNLALLEPESGTLHLAAEWTGTFPLYYVEHGGGLLFCSLLRPLARAAGAAPDEVGVLEFLRQAYTFAGRTQFRGVRRLLPGQSLRFRGGAATLAEKSTAWTGPAEPDDAPEAAGRAWSLLRASLASAAAGGGRTALMMSAGWDSRTLFAAARGAPGELACYSHGDVRSRELGIVERICRDADVPVFLEPVDERVWDLDALQWGFARTGNVVFPHWHRAGRLLAGAGARRVVAGVYGEILGGHYGPAMLAGGRRKVAAVAGTLLGRGGGAAPGGGPRAARDSLRLPALGKHWYLGRDYEAAIPAPLEAINADVDAALDRLEARGITERERLVEAFVSEHRGTQYINTQLLSCRAALDVALPFADREAFVLATRLPLPAKIHNRVNREMLRRHAPALLRYPLAATLVSAGSPLVLQEASRLARNSWEKGRWRLHFRSRGAVRPPRLGWVNFEFLRSGRALEALIDDLRCDLWDRDALRRRAAAIREGSWRHQLHPIFDQLSKIYTTDLLLR